MVMHKKHRDTRASVAKKGVPNRPSQPILMTLQKGQQRKNREGAEVDPQARGTAGYASESEGESGFGDDDDDVLGDDIKKLRTPASRKQNSAEQKKPIQNVGILGEKSDSEHWPSSDGEDPEGDFGPSTSKLRRGKEQVGRGFSRSVQHARQNTHSDSDGNSIHADSPTFMSGGSLEASWSRLPTQLEVRT